MSGAQIGAVVGGVIGAFFGMPQLGAAIGGMIGGWISPTQVNGPRIGDQADQSSQEGQPIPWVMGTCGWIQGNIVDKSKVREVKKTDDGKGSGTEVNTFEAHQDFCILICESSEHRESLMVGVLIVKVDGKIVYDMRPESNFGADNAKFLKNHAFYDGNESQLPDPTMEALPHNGVGNTPYYRGVFTMVARDINLSQYGERIPVYQFVMVGDGDSNEEVVTSLHPLVWGRFRNSFFPPVDPATYYQYQAFWTDTTAGGIQSPLFDTMDECRDWFFDETGIEAAGSYIGYSANSQGWAGQYTDGTDGAGHNVTFTGYEAQADVTMIESLTLLYQWHLPDQWDDIIGNDFCTLAEVGTWRGNKQGIVYQKFPGASPPPDLLSFDNCGGSQWAAGYYPFCIRVVPKYGVPSAAPVGDPCALGMPVQLPGVPGYVIDCAGIKTPEPTYESITGSFLVLQDEAFVTIDNVEWYTKFIVGPLLEVTDPDNTQAFWESEYAAAVSAGTMLPGKTYPADYPVSIGEGYSATITTEDISVETLGLDTALTRISVRGGLTENDIDVTEMDQQVQGYMITQSYTGADSIRPLMTAFKSYGSEYDAKLRFHKHGEAIDLVIDPQDIIQGTEDSDQTTRDQQVEFPRTYSLTYIDATQDYTARPQVDRRISNDVRAIGEIQTQVAVVLAPDYARQLANVGMKVNWARAMGSREFSVPYAGYDVYLRAVAGKPFAMDSQRRILSEMSLQDGEIQFKGLYDRQSAYTSDVTATPGLPPTAPPSNIGGVTLFAAMNLPTLRPQDAISGMYVAVDGLLDSWPGCALQMSIDDGATWTTAIGSMTQSSVMGYLTAPIDDQPTSTLSVRVHGGELNTVTPERIADGANGCAVITQDVSEILQFQTAAEVDPDDYDLTDLVRGGLGTTAASHFEGDRFVQLDSVYFLPIDASFAGRTIKFRPVTFGTPPESNGVYSVVFEPPAFIIDGGEVT